MLNENAEVKVGDFVEAVFIVDGSITRRGIVIEVLNQKTVVVRGKDFQSTCENPRIIPMEDLFANELELVVSWAKTIPVRKEG